MLSVYTDWNWYICPFSSGLLQRHWVQLQIFSVPMKQYQMILSNIRFQWITHFGNESGDWLKILRVTQLRWESLHKSPKIVLHGKAPITLFFLIDFMFWRHISNETNYRPLMSPLSPRRSFLNEVLGHHHSIMQVDMWLHASVGHWYCDFIFDDYSCTRKLTQLSLRTLSIDALAKVVIVMIYTWLTWLYV